MKEKGITLIALVITIIVLLILAGVTIAMVTGENGIITKAIIAGEEQKKAEYKERTELIIMDELTERNVEPKEELVIQSLKEKIENSKQQENWIDSVYMCDQGGVEHNPEIEKNNRLIVETKDGYEVIIEVDNEGGTAKVIEVHKGIGKKYKVTYEPNGGQGAKETIEIRHGFSILVKENDYSKEGYKFAGWSENKDGSGERYLEGSRYQPKKEITLYAVWEVNIVTIYFDSNGGTGTMEEATITGGQKTKLPINRYTKTGYKFLEWNTKTDGSGDKYSDGGTIEITENITLHAIWEENITITLNLNQTELTEGMNIGIVATSMATQINKIQLKIGNVLVYEENVGSTAKSVTKTVNQLQNIKTLTFYTNYEIEAKAISKTGKESSVKKQIMDYTVGSKNDLVRLSNLVEGGETFQGKKAIVQVADIEMSGGPFTSIGYYTSADDYRAFSGTYNGQTWNTSNLTINQNLPRATGLFGYIKEGSLREIGIISATITYTSSESRAVAPIVGRIDNGTVMYCYVDENTKVQSTYSAGGVVGSVHNTTITRLSSNGTVMGTLVAGGVAVSANANSIIEKCSFAGSIQPSGSSGEYKAGGIVGTITSGSIIRECINYGSVSRTGGEIGYIGGIAGSVYESNSQISSCYNRGAISSTSGNTYIGGVCGLVYQNAKITSCYSTGKITGNYRFGRCSWTEMELIQPTMVEL